LITWSVFPATEAGEATVNDHPKPISSPPSDNAPRLHNELSFEIKDEPREQEVKAVCRSSGRAS
jgi:hypothetical protein